MGLIEIMNVDELKQQVVTDCVSLLQAAVRLVRNHFGSTLVPTRDVEVEVMELDKPGHWSGKKFMHQEIDDWRMYDFISNELSKSNEWVNASKTLEAYTKKHNVEPVGFFMHDVGSLYLAPLFRLYLRATRGFVYHRSVAERIVGELLNNLSTPSPEVKGLIILEGFSSPRPFQLESTVHIHPISRDELIELGRIDTILDRRFGEKTPRTDWWVCEVRLPNPRGTSEGFNRMHDVSDLLALAFRAFKPGGLSIGTGTIQLVDVFGRMGQIRGGRLDRIDVGETKYSLSSKEIPAFRRFWQNFKKIMEQDQHYLQVPIRRLRAAGTRTQKEDALVDYVIGLEALLGTAGEKTEMSYRFRIRGAVLLAKYRSERRGHLRLLGELYNLRSRIVHGQTVSNEELERALPKAEGALRTVWRWYFDRYADKIDNAAGIKEIDEKLVG